MCLLLDHYYSPSEILQIMPELREKRFFKEDFGMLVRLNLVQGYRDRGRNTTMIRGESFLNFLSYINSNIDSLKIDFNAPD